MQELKCPKCGEIFKVDETGYSAIVQQVRDLEFNKEIEKREKQFNEEKDSALKLANAEAEKNLSEEIKRKEEVITRLINEKTIIENNYKLEKQEIINKNAMLLQEKENNIQTLTAKIESERENALKLAKAEIEKEYTEKLSEKDKTISEKENALKDAVHKQDILVLEKEGDIKKLSANLLSLQQDKQISEQNIKEIFEKKLKEKDEQIEYFRDLKVRQSTKMVGETLEQHCEIEFNKLRATAFKGAYFEKDNDARTGSKGDYIYRETDENGNEIISIMFEMKNQCDETATKKKNEDFFKELDKDRKEKNCEYAVLVSLLELENDFYNAGIADVSYKFPKMYVVRPQNFITIITLLRDAALNSMDYKRQLVEIRNQNIDIANFESNMNEFKDKFSRNYNLASKKFQEAIDGIDKTIKQLEKTKQALLSSENNLRLANKKAEDLSIKQLTADSPTVRVMFSELKNKNI